MNAQDLADELNLPTATITAAVKSTNADPSNFDKKTGDRVRSMVAQTAAQQNKDVPKKIAAGAQTKKEEESPCDKTEIENYQNAVSAIRERQTQQKLDQVRERGSFVGSLLAVEEFKGELEGYASTRTQLAQMLQSRDNEFFQQLLGDSVKPSQLLPAVYHHHENRQESQPANLLEAWEQKTGLNWNYE